MWQLKPGQLLRLRAFGDESVLYNDLSGDTHLLGASAILLLGQLRHQPAATDSLYDSLAEAIGCPRDAAFDAEAGALVAQLAGFFLIEPGSC
jgi:PqqD family protein of HPr-rel-A system